MLLPGKSRMGFLKFCLEVFPESKQSIGMPRKLLVYWLGKWGEKGLFSFLRINKHLNDQRNGVCPNVRLKSIYPVFPGPELQFKSK